MALLELLKGSDDPSYDQHIFLKSQIAFWLLAAVDGHAKNFSVFLHPYGGFQLTPIYDVMSAQHLYEKKQLRRKDLKLAMSVGDRNHSGVHDILPRHYQQTVDQAGLPESILAAVLDEIVTDLPIAIEKASATLEADFPSELRDSIAEGALSRLKRIAQ